MVFLGLLSYSGRGTRAARAGVGRDEGRDVGNYMRTAGGHYFPPLAIANVAVPPPSCVQLFVHPTLSFQTWRTSL
eukprot:15431778-Alexandrium_andersonii.AAC.1